MTYKYYAFYNILRVIILPSFAKSLSLHRDIQPFAEYAVTPFVGVWIETNNAFSFTIQFMSHPSWVCGLKHDNIETMLKGSKVTPFVGVWIETYPCRYRQLSEGHTLRGCVD